MLRLSVPAKVGIPALAAAILVTGSVVAAVGFQPRHQAPQTSVVQAVSRPAPAIEVSRVRPVVAAKPATARPLKRLIVADLMMTTATPLSANQISKVLAIRGVTADTVISTGTVRVGPRAIYAMGVDPSSFRPWTPKETASSDALWNAVAGGQLAGSYVARLPLGANVHVFGKHAIDGRIGAVAAYDLPESGLVVDRAVARQVGLVTNTLLLAAPSRTLSYLEKDITEVVGKTAFTELRPVKVTDRRPATYRELYMLSATYCQGLSWTILAAIGQIESDHGRNDGPSSAGALGPMQFLPSTWQEYGVDGDGDGKADIMDPYDAVPAAALYLCHNGAGAGGQSLYDAIFAYNHADWYVKEVLALAAQYK